MEGEINLGINN